MNLLLPLSCLAKGMTVSISAVPTGSGLNAVGGRREAIPHRPLLNPNGWPDGIAGLTSRDGRATILMPHPERTLRSANFSWAPKDWAEDSPWLRMFRNARVWVG
jgi:hypothetical protein